MRHDSGKSKLQFRGSWYEKLGSWTEALEAYQHTEAMNSVSLLGTLRCLKSLGQFDTLTQRCAEIWSDENLIGTLNQDDVIAKYYIS